MRSRKLLKPCDCCGAYNKKDRVRWKVENKSICDQCFNLVRRAEFSFGWNPTMIGSNALDLLAVHFTDQYYSFMKKVLLDHQEITIQSQGMQGINVSSVIDKAGRLLRDLKKQSQDPDPIGVTVYYTPMGAGGIIPMN